MGKYKLIAGKDLIKQVQEALNIEHTRRIILDIGLDTAVFVYVEFIGDERLYDIDFDDFGIKIKESTRSGENK